MLIYLLLIVSITAKRHVQVVPECFLENCKNEVMACRKDEQCWAPMINCLIEVSNEGARKDELVNQAKECVKNQKAIDFLDCTYKNCPHDYKRHHKDHRFY